jgi:hypothetical protein
VRYIDIAVAILIGTSSIAALVNWSPTSFDANSDNLKLQTSLRDGLLTYYEQRGTVWFMQSNPSAVCSDLGRLANSSVGFGASFDATSCGGSPPAGSVVASISFTISSMKVTLRAWEGALE